MFQDLLDSARRSCDTAESGFPAQGPHLAIRFAFAGQIVGIRQVDDQIWLVSFLDFDLGFLDREE